MPWKGGYYVTLVAIPDWIVTLCSHFCQNWVVAILVICHKSCHSDDVTRWCHSGEANNNISWIPWHSSFRYIHCTGQFTPKMKANAEPRLLSSLVWIDSGVVVSQYRLESFFNEIKCNGMMIFMEFMSCVFCTFRMQWLGNVTVLVSWFLLWRWDYLFSFCICPYIIGSLS